MSFLGINLVTLVQAAGYIGIFAIVFAESGLFVGFFLPGDSLLITAGILASQGYFSFVLLALLAFAGAVLGDSVGYAFGRHVGPRLFRREDSFFFHRSHLIRAQEFYKKHGGKTLILGRFMPIIRTFVPILAGVGEMAYGRFLSYNIVGGFLWGVGGVTLGYYLGAAIPGIDRYIYLLIVVIVFLSFLPGIIHILRGRESRRAAVRVVRSVFRRLLGRS